MEPRHKKSLVWRVGVGLIVVETMVALLIGVYEYNNLKAFNFEQSRVRLRSVCRVIADSYADPLKANDRQSLRELVISKANESDLRVTLISASGEVLGDSHRDSDLMDNHKDRPEIRAALADGEGSSVRFSKTLGEEAMYYARRVDTESTTLGVVRVAASVAYVSAQLASVAQTIAIAGTMWIVATILSIVFFSAKLSLEIGRLGAVASRLATGDLSTTHLRAPGREFEPFVQSLNDMASQLRQRVEELRSSQREQVAILRSMESGVIAVDRDQRVLRLNPAAQRMLHIPEVHARGMTLGEIGPRSPLAAHISNAFQTGSITTEDIEFDDPSPTVIRAASSVLREPSGEVVGLLIMLTDITHIRRLESMRRDFAANVSHELRTPITNIQGFAETLLTMPLESTVEHREFLEIISRNALRLGSIVEDLLTLSRLEREELQADLETMPVPVARVIDTVLDILRPRMSEAHVTIATEVKPTLMAVINEHLIEQAISNLLINAMQHSPQGGTITITAESVALDTGSRLVEISIQDEGPGIAQEHLPRLFERFFRVSNSQGRSDGGTGLGLAIVKHIVLAHSGSVSVTSELGNGACFKVVLPTR